jgi:polyisoprenoid-binding protein YceI
MSWIIDPAHTQIGFSVRHMMIATVRGQFDSFAGTVEYDETNPAATTIDLTIEAASINTRQADRDGHLKSPDFLNADEYPHISFKSTHVELVNEFNARLVGNLTIKDVTRKVALDVQYVGQARSPWGTTSAGFNASTTINRKDWGLVWNQALETGGVLVGEEMNISVEVELIRQEEQASA